ncbi:MAG TPA: hypothetical protein PK431_15805 [Chitinophagales bacterium]|nr:hypothetical protein [Chitinophagales bacterium]
MSFNFCVVAQDENDKRYKEIYSPNVIWAGEAKQTIELKNIKKNFFPIDSFLLDKIKKNKIKGFAYPEDKVEFIKTKEEIEALYNNEADTLIHNIEFVGYPTITKLSQDYNNYLFLKQTFYLDNKNNLISKIIAVAPVKKYDTFDSIDRFFPVYYTSVNNAKKKIKKEDFIVRTVSDFSFNNDEFVLKKMFNKSIDDIIFEKIKSGDFKIYGLINKEPLTKSQIEDSMGFICCDLIYVPDPITGLLTKYEFKSQSYQVNVTGYKIVQDIYFSKKKNIFYSKVLAICPMFKSNVGGTVEENNKNIYWLFWIAFNNFNPKEIKLK